MSTNRMPECVQCPPISLNAQMSPNARMRPMSPNASNVSECVQCPRMHPMSPNARMSEYPPPHIKNDVQRPYTYMTNLLNCPL